MNRPRHHRRSSMLHGGLRVGLGLVAVLLAGTLVWLAPPGLGAWRVEVDRRFDVEGHTRTITAVAVAADGTTVASGDSGGQVRWWRPGPLDAEPRVLDTEGSVIAVALDGRGDRLAVAGSKGRVRVWRETSAGPEVIFELQARGVRALGLDRSGRYLALSADQTLVLDLEAAEPDLHARTLGPGDPPSAFSFDASSARLAVLSGRRITVVDLGTDERSSFDVDHPASHLAIDGDRIAIASPSRLEVRSHLGDRLAVTELETESPTAVGLDGDRVDALTGDGQQVTWIWRSGLAGPPTIEPRDARPLGPSALAAQARVGVAGGRDGVVRVWNDGQARLLGPPRLTAGMSRDRRWVAVSAAPGTRGFGQVTVRGWPDGAIRRRRTLERVALCLAWEPKAVRIHLAGGDRARWDVETDSIEAGDPATDIPCPTISAGRFETTILPQIAEDVLFLRDRRSDLLIPLANDFVRAADVPRTWPDRFWVRFPIVGLPLDGSLVYATIRPQLPLPPLLAGLIVGVRLLFLLSRRKRGALSHTSPNHERGRPA